MRRQLTHLVSIVGLFLSWQGLGSRIAAGAMQEAPGRTLDSNQIRTELARIGALSKAKQFPEAERGYRQLVTRSGQALGDRHDLTIEARNGLAKCLLELSRFDEAVTVAQKARDDATALHGSNHPDTVFCQYQHGVSLNRAGRHTEAQRELDAAFRTLREMVPDHALTTDTGCEIASNLMELGRHEPAETLFRWGLSQRIKQFGETDPQTTTVALNLIQCLKLRSKLTEADRLSEQVLALARQEHRGQPELIATALSRRSDVLTALDRFAEAEALARESLKLSRSDLGESADLTLALINNYAYLLNQMGRYPEAERLYREALRGRQRVNSESSPRTALVYDNLATCLHAQGRLAEAETLQRTALAIRTKSLGPDHRLTAESVQDLAGILHDQGRLAEAAVLYRHAIAVYEQSVGHKDPDTANALNSLAVLLDEVGAHQEAQSLFEDAHEIRESTLGPDHALTLSSRNNLAANLAARGRLVEAEALHRRNFEASRKSRGERHPDTSLYAGNLGVTLAEMGRLEDAERILKDALEIDQRTFGAANRRTINDQVALAAVLRKRNERAESRRILKDAVRGEEAARLRVGWTGTGRAQGIRNSPRIPLAIDLAESGEAEEAWQTWESWLARGLLDEISARDSRTMSEKDRAREAYLARQLEQIDEKILRLASLPGALDSPPSEFRELVELRGALFTDLLKHAEELQRLYGASVGTTTELAEVQKRLEPDEAIIGWISRGDELWSCILRSESAPRWVRLQNRTVAGGIPDVLHPGTIPTLDPEERVEALREHLHTPWRKPAKVEAERLLVPLLAELAGIRRLVMLPWPGLDGTPIETLVATLPPPRDQLVVSYAPSASMLAQLRTASGKSKQSIATGRLLAVGDPSSPKRGVDSSASLTPRSAYGSGALGSSFRSRSIDGAHRRERDRIEDGRIR